ncbi:MAG: signal peptidase I [Candidatus Sedimenticola endophacoides]
MSLDFPTFLVLATLITGLVWLADTLFFAKVRRARAAADGEAEVREPLIVEYSRSFFPIILAVFVLRSFLVEPFRIPSGSMMPTLLVGDFILVNKFTYGLRVPVLNRKILELGEPERGDVIVFKYPQNPSVDYIKRVIGVPGDRVAYYDKTLFINGEAQPQSNQGRYNGVGSGAHETGVLHNRERLGGVEHDVLVNPMAPDFNFGCIYMQRAGGEITVPRGHYFVMGDNRDNSNDGRCWGMVPEGNLVGKAFGIWMNWDGNLPGLPIDFGRIGQGIE